MMKISALSPRGKDAPDSIVERSYSLIWLTLMSPQHLIWLVIIYFSSVLRFPMAKWLFPLLSHTYLKEAK